MRGKKRRRGVAGKVKRANAGGVNRGAEKIQSEGGRGGKEAL